MFHSAGVLSRCYVCFAMIFKCFSRVFFQVLQTHVSSVLSIFFFVRCKYCIRMFSKVDLVLHKLLWLYTHMSSVSSVFRRTL
jgi:hypothetical protein